MPLVNAHYHPKSPDWLIAGSPTGVFREGMISRRQIGADLAALSTGVMFTVAVPLEAGDVVTSITFKSGATAAGTPTHWWFALYDSSATPALLAQSADQAAAAWAANTAKTLALATAQTITTPGVYYAAVMVAATTPPTLLGFTSNANATGGVLAADKAIAQTSGSALAAAAPATIATPAASASVPYVVLT